MTDCSTVGQKLSKQNKLIDLALKKEIIALCKDLSKEVLKLDFWIKLNILQLLHFVKPG